jgi:hypothetical protein
MKNKHFPKAGTSDARKAEEAEEPKTRGGGQ